MEKAKDIFSSSEYNECVKLLFVIDNPTKDCSPAIKELKKLDVKIFVWDVSSIDNQEQLISKKETGWNEEVKLKFNLRSTKKSRKASTEDKKVEINAQIKYLYLLHTLLILLEM